MHIIGSVFVEKNNKQHPWWSCGKNDDSVWSYRQTVDKYPQKKEKENCQK